MPRQSASCWVIVQAGNRRRGQRRDARQRPATCLQRGGHNNRGAHARPGEDDAPMRSCSGVLYLAATQVFRDHRGMRQRGRGLAQAVHRPAVDLHGGEGSGGKLRRAAVHPPPRPGRVADPRRRALLPQGAGTAADGPRVRAERPGRQRRDRRADRHRLLRDGRPALPAGPDRRLSPGLSGGGDPHPRRRAAGTGARPHLGALRPGLPLRARPRLAHRDRAAAADPTRCSPKATASPGRRKCRCATCAWNR